MSFLKLRDLRNRGTYKPTSGSSAPKTPETLYLPPGSLDQSFLWFLIVCCLQAAAIIILIVVVFVDIILQHYNDKLTTRGQIGYTAVTTLIATAIATTTEGEIRKLWAFVAVKKNAGVRREGRGQDARPAVIVGLAGFWDNFKKAHITVVFGLAGLVTLGIVTGLQPTSMTVVRDMPIYLSRDRNVSEDAVLPLGRECNEPWVSLAVDRLPTKWFSWEQPDGTNLTVRANINAGRFAQIRCPTYAIRSTFETLDQNTTITLPGSINVNRYAFGVPFDLLTNRLIGIKSRFQDVHSGDLATWSALSFESASMCIPVIKDNIASCERAGSFNLTNSRATISHGNCTISRRIDGEDELTQERLFVSGACTGSRQVGKSRVLIGATWDYADELCATTNFAVDEEREDLPVCAVACEIDVAPSIEFRRVILKRAEASEEQTRLFEVVGARMNDAGEVVPATNRWGDLCSPTGADGRRIDVSDFLTETALAASAAASWQLLAEGDLEDGYLATLLTAAEKMEWNSGSNRDTSSGSSRSALEELLTMASRLALGFHYGTYADTKEQLLLDAGDYVDYLMEVNEGKSAYKSVRVGTKNALAILFILPSVFAEIVLWTLWWRMKKVMGMSRAGEKLEPVEYGESGSQFVS